MESFVANELLSLLQEGNNLDNYFGIYAEKPQSFRFKSSTTDLISDLEKYVNTTKMDYWKKKQKQLSLNLEANRTAAEEGPAGRPNVTIADAGGEKKKVLQLIALYLKNKNKTLNLT